MSSFLDLYPRIYYDITKGNISNYDIVANITFRINIIKEVLSNMSAYYEYEIGEGETPEIVAEKVYGNPEAYWIILYANEIYDPLYDWPLSYRTFKNFIVGKYGSIEAAKLGVHHYEKIIEQEDTSTGTVYTSRYIIGEDNLLTVQSSNITLAPETFFDDLTAEADWRVYTVSGRTFRQRTYRNEISNYDYEDELNNSKRLIKVIKAEYYPRIIREFEELTDTRQQNLRRIV